MPTLADPSTISPEDRAFVQRLHAGAGAPPAPSAPPSGARPGGFTAGYQKVIEPVTKAATHVLAGAGEQIAHPEWSLGQGLEAIKQNYYTPADKLPPLARSIAEAVIPQTPTAAAIDVASTLLPEAKIAELGGETLGPVAKLVGSRFGRVAATTATGAATGAATGEGTLKGALQGAAATIPAETGAAIVGAIGRHVGEPSLIADTTAKFGKALKSRLPWLGKMETGSDFADHFIHGQAIDRAGNLLRRVKSGIAQDARGYTFHVGLPGPTGIQGVPMTFEDADRVITELQRGYGFTLGGAERSGANARGARFLSYDIRDQLAADLNRIKPRLGEAYLKARKQFEIANHLTNVFDAKDLIGRHGLNQAKLVERMNEYALDLDRGMGKGAARDLLGILRRGFIGEGKDIPGSPAGRHLIVGPMSLPHFRITGGHPAQPIGELPAYMRPSAKKYEALISNVIGAWRKPEHQPALSPAVPAAQKKRNATIAGPHASAERIDAIGDASTKMASAKPADMQTALASGRVSLGHVRKMLDANSGTDVASIFQGLSPQDSIDVLAKASPQEREMFLPVVAQRIQDAGSKMPPPAQQALIAQLRSVMQQPEATA